jgi:hypothetical protein
MFEPPQLETAYLNEVVQAFVKRSKALKRKFKDLRLERIYDEAAVPPMECLQVSFRTSFSPSGPRVKLRVWENRWVWVDARQPSKAGWLWSSTSEGRIAGGKSGTDVLRALENFYILLPNHDYMGDLDGAAQVWSDLLLSGQMRSVK